MTSRWTNEGGFTLVELLMAMFVFGVGLLGIMSMQLTSVQTNSRADSLMVASALAASVLEETMARPATDALFTVPVANFRIIPDWDYTANTPNDDDTPSWDIRGAGRMTVDRSITVITPPPGITRVDIVVLGENRRTVTVSGFKMTKTPG